MKEGTNYRIGMGVSILLVVVAIALDLFSLLPGVASVTGPVYWFLVGAYFWHKGISIVSVRKIAVGIFSSVIEAIPVIQAAPSLTIGIILVLIFVRIEDKAGISVEKLKIPGTTPPRLSRPKLNSQQGIRYPNKN